jgi:adenylate cyclase
MSPDRENDRAPTGEPSSDDASERVRRRLTVILAADIAGYSRLVGNDEEGTLAQWKNHWKALIEPSINKYRGRIVRVVGDGLLVEFASVVDAVRCAVEVQRGMAARNIEVPQEKRIELRVGINFGELVIDGADFWGDGVNIAARLEALAEPGGICVSGRVQEDAEGKLDIVFEDAGEQQLKNIARPVHVYRVRLHDLPARPAVLTLPDKPSIAVMPFENLNHDPKQDYFADGVSEDIITELSRFSVLFVIARNSSFKYKGKVVDLRQVGRELGVRYALEGSIRRGGGRVRITAQLVETDTGMHRWAERYDRELKDVLTIQDEVARTIAAILVAHVNKAEAERSLLKPPATWQAYDHYMRAAAAWVSFQSSWKIEDLSETRRHLAESLSIDSKYARAYSMLASTHRVAWLNPLNEEYLSQAALDRAIEFARAAIELNPNLPEAYAELGYNLIRRREFDAAIAAVEKAMALNPNFADYRLATVLSSVGEPAKAIEVAKAQMRLDPFHPHFAPLMVGIAHYLLKQYHEAQRWLREATGRAPNHQYGHAFLAATYAQLGQLEDAQGEAAEVLRINPKYTISGTQKRVFILKGAEDIEHTVVGLRKAGLPE